MSIEIVSELTQDDLDPRNKPYTPHGKFVELFYYQGREVLLAGAAGTGKAQPLDSLVMTPNGPKKMGDIRIGDDVIHPTSGTSKVWSIHPQGIKDVYEIEFSTGEKVKCCGDHLWEVNWIGGGQRNGNQRRQMTAVLPLREILKNYQLRCGSRGHRPKYWVKQTDPVVFGKKKHYLDPYVVGVLLGDGTTTLHSSPSISSADKEVVDLFRSRLPKEFTLSKPRGITYGIIRSSEWVPQNSFAFAINHRHADGKYKVSLSDPNTIEPIYPRIFSSIESARTFSVLWKQAKDIQFHRSVSLRDLFEKIGLARCDSFTKFVPEDYLYSSIEDRLELVRGLMDTDGTVDYKTGMPSYSSTSLQLAQGMVSLIESLGGLASVTWRQTVSGRGCFMVWIRYNNPADLFHLTRKKKLCKKRTKYPVKRMMISIRQVERIECQCITVSASDGLYLTDHYVVTHNSMCSLSRLFMLAEQYPGCRCLIVRKTRESMSQSTLVTWESKVVPDGHPCLAGPSRRNRDSYAFPNGSEIICGGMKQSGRDATQKIMSTDYDFIYAPEAIEFSAEEYGRLLSRLRNNVSPFKQIITDTNPSHPQHWLKRRCDDGLCKMIETRHRDNPLLYDHAKNDWTPFGREYLNSLESLEGALRDRLYLGKWAQAEGVVYTNWNDQIHVVDDFEIPKHWKRYCAVDFGVNDPMVALYAAQDPEDKKVYLYREYVRTGEIVEYHAAEMKKLEKGEKIDATICDHDKNSRLTLEKHLGRSTTPANKKDILAGIDCVQTFLKNQAHGSPGLYVFESLRNTFDKTMDERKLPMGIIQEMPSYVWDQSVQKGIKDKPVDRDNHSIDTLRYLCMYLKDASVKWVAPDAMKTPEPIPTFQRPRGPLNNMPQFRRNNQSPFGR